VDAREGSVFLKRSKTVKKVLAWRILSLILAGITSQVFLGPGMEMESWGLTIYLAVQMTAVHFFFERMWVD